jgi:hypothetical protein
MSTFKMMVGAVALVATLGACGSPPPQRSLPVSAWQRVETARTAHIVSAACPKVGEQAVAPVGQIAVTRGGLAVLYDTMKDANSGREVWFIPTKGTSRDTGSWIGQNAFGATARVTTRQLIANGVAVAMDPPFFDELGSMPETIVRRVAFEAGITTGRTPTGTKLWVSGPVVDGAFNDSSYFEATFTSPIEARWKYHADQTIKLECAAFVDEGGTVVKRLY